MSQPRTPYGDAILDHSRNPRNQRTLEGATHRHTATNPLCGDRVTIEVELVGERIEALAFRARGCALCIAAASMMTEWLTGHDVADIAVLRAQVDQALDPAAPEVEEPVAGLMPIRSAPSRNRCATLPWEAIGAAVAEAGD